MFKISLKTSKRWTEVDPITFEVIKIHDVAICSNTVGSFDCYCPEGFEGDGVNSCENINECDIRNEWGYLPCSPNAQCQDYEGTYTCSCYPGYTGAGTADDPCEDEDECSLGRHNCLATGARCVNGEGSFTCECTTGVGDGVTSCSVASVCNPNPCREPEEKCTAVGATWQCDCADGFTHDIDGVCNNEDECKAGIHTCDSTGAIPSECTDTIGSFTCSCPVGYVMNTGGQCEDINECLQIPSLCVPYSNCKNTVGTYECECQTGFTGTAGPYPDIVSLCTDKDECALSRHSCITVGFKLYFRYFYRFYNLLIGDIVSL